MVYEYCQFCKSGKRLGLVLNYSYCTRVDFKTTTKAFSLVKEGLVVHWQNYLHVRKVFFLDPSQGVYPKPKSRHGFRLAECRGA